VRWSHPEPVMHELLPSPEIVEPFQIQDAATSS
jgi:hypothetical protein